MSFIDAVPPRPAQPTRSGWRWFPWAIIASLAVVIVVNAGMMWAALSTFPGVAGRDGFDLSNHYDHVLDAAAREAALGWKVEATVDTSGQPSVTLLDRTGGPLNGAHVAATAARPLGPAMDMPLTFRASGSGHYVASQALPEKGQWDLLLSATVDGRNLTATRRVIVR